MIRVLIAEDAHLLRIGLIALLRDEEDISVTETLDCGWKLVAAARHDKPDVALIDVDLTDMDGFTATRLIRTELALCSVVLMAAQRRPGDLRRAVAAGAVGFVLKDASPADLVDAIRRVARGEPVIDAELALAELAAVDCPLTPRETDVLRATAEGATVGEIASELYLSSGTVRNYLGRIVTKVGARTRVEAVKIARQNGWLD